ncbi:hypothetical protein JTB14_020722 [Gonioctena quinquepunctata]|nr:hypothetical protein JTB14_020722 [Gonioctena quinquepunctata]
MQWIITLVVVSIVSSSHAYLDSDDLGDIVGPLSKIWHKKCATILGVTDRNISNLQQGIFNDDNENVKRYPLCLRIVGGLLSPNLEVNDELFEKLPENLKKLKHNYVDCISEAKESNPLSAEDTFEIVWAMEKCLYKKDQEVSIFIEFALIN